MNMEVIVQQTPLFMFVLSIMAAIFVFMQFSKHKIMVEVLEYVDGGFISKSFRCCKMKDRRTRTKHLKPMFSKKTLYQPSNMYFKKVNGMPFIGVNRHITFIKDGVDLKAVLPSKDTSNLAEVSILDYRRWFFLKQREEFLRNINKDKIMFLLSIYAPLIVIVSTILFFAITIIYQIGVINNISHEIKEISKAIINTVT